MRQGIILSLFIIFLSAISIYYFKPVFQGDEINLIVDGETIGTNYLNKEAVIWLVEENDETIILQDEEILRYYNLDLQVKDLTNQQIITEQVMHELVGTNHYNLIEIKEEGVRVYQTNCPDKLCVHIGFIQKKGEVIICAPHKLVIKILGEEGGLDG